MAPILFITYHLPSTTHHPHTSNYTASRCFTRMFFYAIPTFSTCFITGAVLLFSHYEPCKGLCHALLHSTFWLRNLMKAVIFHVYFLSFHWEPRPEWSKRLGSGFNLCFFLFFSFFFTCLLFVFQGSRSVFDVHFNLLWRAIG